ncbi:MAG: outer membrane beta-barrel domain-containing protein [Bradymonadaceae bacterium]
MSKRILAVLALTILSLTAMSVALTIAPGDAWAEETDLDEELQQFWSSERELSVLHDRLYHRAGRLALGIHVGLLSSEPFFYYYPVGGRISYHFTNQTALEVGGSFMDAPGILTHDTELTEFARERRGESFDSSTDTEDRFLWRSNVVFLWSPFYGKLAFLQRKLAHFDFNVAIGAGAAGVERPDRSDTPKSSANKVVPEGVFGGGVQFFMTPSMTVRLDGRFYVYRGAEVRGETWSEQVNLPAEFLLGFSYLF